MIWVMSYQYLWCASCATRRTGHGYQCSVCGGLLRHNTPRVQATPATLRTTVTWQAPVAQPAKQPERQPVTA
jgi:hypothetical protein